MSGTWRQAWWVPVTLALVVAIFVPCLLNALAWINRPFSGLLFLENGVVVSIGRTDWMAPQSRRAQWTRLLAVDGQPVAGGRDVHAYVSAAGLGQRLTYTFRQGTDMFRLALDVRAFRLRDFLELFAPLLAVGMLMVLSGALVAARRPDAPAARALFVLCLGLGLLLITGPDQYFPYWFSTIYWLSFCSIPPAIGQLALTYPQPSALLRRGPLVYVALYAPFLGLGAALLAARFDPAFFLPLLYALYFLVANGVLLYAGSLTVALIGGVRPRRPLLLALAGMVTSSLTTVAVSVTYPLLQRPISPLWIVGPWLLFPALTGVALLRFPVVSPPGREEA
jgi:hypothetical protein